MPNYNLSYIISTKNRLLFLRITLSKLIAQLQPDEEIVVVDANSTDGTKEYLEQLFKEEKIHQFISEPDRNQAHGWNKGMLLAKGTIIKKVIDDDVFCYEAIRKCKDYMLHNADVDVVISNDLGSSLSNPHNIDKYTRRLQFEEWQKELVPSFTFGDVHLLIRRTSLAYIGLYNTSFINMDWEYSLKISYSKAKIIYYTGYNALTVSHSQTVTSLRDLQLIKAEGERGKAFYNYAGDEADISYWSKIKIFIGTIVYRQDCSKIKAVEKDSFENIESIYDNYYNYILELNNTATFDFLG